ADTDYFGPGPQSHMLNFRVDDLDALLEQLRADGVEVDERIDQSDFGRFGWIVDPEGTRVELWQPPA
ncbi:MAG TPA: VOC family protein, partial [Rhodanobacter sp.]|nr:VOC family protein [Rhodanobacter sp.]